MAATIALSWRSRDELLINGLDRSMVAGPAPAMIVVNFFVASVILHARCVFPVALIARHIPHLWCSGLPTAANRD
jgi:hypothetical protein